MAFPASFDESNTVLSKPSSMSHDECDALSVLKTDTEDGMPIVISCWKLTADEIEEINLTRRVWLVLVGHTMPPAVVSGLKPFEVPDAPT